MEADPSMHSVIIAPHLWRALEVMARDMAVEPSALVNQAVFAWLRINGYTAPGTLGQLGKGPLPAVSPTPSTATRPEPKEPTRSGLLVTPVAPVAAPRVGEADPESAALEGVVARMGEIDDDLARLVQPKAAWARPPVEEPETGEEEIGSAPDEEAPDRELLGPVEVDEEPVAFAQVRSEAPEVTSSPVPQLLEAEEGTVLLRSNPMVAYVQREGEPRVRIANERFIIGRGPQCDLIIDSPRVSREHAAFVRSGASYVIEDLGSSNGTWFNDERIMRRELESGDVVRLGNELVSFFLFAEAR